MARKSSHWDLSHLASKYPWLRVDTDTIQEFRSPFHWVPLDAQEPRSGARSDGQTLERDLEELFSLSHSKRTRTGRHGDVKQHKWKVQQAHPGRKSPNQRPGSTGKPIVAAIMPLSLRKDGVFQAKKYQDDSAVAPVSLPMPVHERDNQNLKQRNAKKKQKWPKKAHNMLSLR